MSLPEQSIKTKKIGRSGESPKHGRMWRHPEKAAAAENRHRTEVALKDLAAKIAFGCEEQLK